MFVKKKLFVNSQMKKLNLIPSAVVMIAIMVTSCGGNTASKSTTTDTLSNKLHIGKQVWMTKNLDVDKFQNGDVIPEAKTEGEWKAYGDAGEAAWCYYDNDRKNGEKYGKLYNWHAVNDSRGLAPKGWHVPTDEEWTILTDYLGGVEKAGAKMKSKNDWFDDGNGTNSSGFSGLPGGVRRSGVFTWIAVHGFWWSSTESATDAAWNHCLYYNTGNLTRNNCIKNYGSSVRCLRD